MMKAALWNPTWTAELVSYRWPWDAIGDLDALRPSGGKQAHRSLLVLLLAFNRSRAPWRAPQGTGHSGSLNL